MSSKSYMLNQSGSLASNELIFGGGNEHSSLVLPPTFLLELINGEVFCGMVIVLTASHLQTFERWERLANTGFVWKLLWSFHYSSKKERRQVWLWLAIPVISSPWRPDWRIVSSRPVIQNDKIQSAWSAWVGEDWSFFLLFFRAPSLTWNGPAEGCYFVKWPWEHCETNPNGEWNHTFVRLLWAPESQRCFVVPHDHFPEW